MCSKIPFKKVNMKIPVIELLLGKEKHHAIVDSGSELTLLDEGFKNAGNEKNYSMNLTGIGGTTRNTAKRSQIVFQAKTAERKKASCLIEGFLIEDTNIFHDANTLYGGDLKIDIILGSDMLQFWNAKIDYENNVLMINDLSCQ